MKTVRMNLVLASLVGATSLFLAIPKSLSDTSGMGWDVFYTGEGDRVSSSYQRTPASGIEGQGFDVFNVGEGVKLQDFQNAYVGTSMGSGASDGWDVFRVGEGDPLP